MTQREQFDADMTQVAAIISKWMVIFDGTSANGFNAFSPFLSALWSAIPNARPPAP